MLCFSPVAADWVRVVKKSDGWLSIGEIDFWGTINRMPRRRDSTVQDRL